VKLSSPSFGCWSFSFLRHELTLEKSSFLVHSPDSKGSAVPLTPNGSVSLSTRRESLSLFFFSFFSYKCTSLFIPSQKLKGAQPGTVFVLTPLTCTLPFRMSTRLFFLSSPSWWMLGNSPFDNHTNFELARPLRTDVRKLRRFFLFSDRAAPPLPQNRVS